MLHAFQLLSVTTVNIGGVVTNPFQTRHDHWHCVNNITGQENVVGSLDEAMEPILMCYD